MKRRMILMGTIVSIVGLAFLMYGINPATPATHDGLAWGGPVTTSAPATTCALITTCASQTALWSFLSSRGHNLCAHDDLLTGHDQCAHDHLCTQDHLCPETALRSVRSPRPQLVRPRRPARRS